MRNPRITGYNEKILKITLDDGSEIKCTTNHEFLMRDGSYKKAEDLKENDSLSISTKYKTTFEEIFKDSNSKSQEYWMINDGEKNIFEHRFIYEQLNNTKIDKGNVIHHKNFNGSDNSIENIILMTKKEHDKYHGDLIKGYKNPYHKMSQDQKNKFASHPGKTNGKYSGYTNQDLLDIMTTWIEENDKMMTGSDWEKLSKEKGYPQYFTSFRGNLMNYIKQANILAGKEFFDSKYDRREYNKYIKLLKISDLELFFENGHIYANKVCEECGTNFIVPYGLREVAYCKTCAKKIRLNKMSNTIKTKTINKHKDQNKLVFDLFTKYVSENKEVPTSQIIHNILKENGFNDFRSIGLKGYKDFLNKISNDYRVKLNTHSISKNENYRQTQALELIDNGMIYNHKVSKIEEIGIDTVYNGTVDDVHNFNIIFNETTTKSGRDKLLQINNMQCGEIVMPPYSLCCLSSVNLTKFISNPFTDHAKFDFDSYKETIEIGIRFLDNVLDVTKYPLEKIETLSKKWRRVGLGFTGLGNVFTMLKIKYGSKESKELSHLLGKTLRDNSYRASIELAKEKGMFDKCDTNKIVKSNFIKQLPKDIIKDIKQYGLRNIALNTTAPTGATSLSLGNNCSSGIEPTFSLYYDRSIRTGVGDEDETKTEKVYDYAWLKYLEYMKENNFAISDTPDYFIPTFDVNEYDAIDIQAIFQKYIDHSISKTLNLPTDITYKNYNKLFMYAYDQELKGFTTFNSMGSVRGILKKKKNILKEQRLLRDQMSWNAIYTK